MLETFSGRTASQNEFELRSLIELMQRHNVRRYCEIGSRDGDTFHEIMRSLPPGSSGLACDLPGALWGKSSSRRSLERAVDDLVRRGYPASTLFGDSKDKDVVEFVAGAGPYDAILIDGDHTYDGVRADWLNYRGMAPIVVFHDIVGIDQFERVSGRSVQVPRLWAEIKAEGYRTEEFIGRKSTMGVGVVFTDSLPLEQHAL